MTLHGLVHKGFHISLLSLMEMYKQKFWLHQEQPNLWHGDVNLNRVHAGGMLSVCVYYDLHGWCISICHVDAEICQRKDT